MHYYTYWLQPFHYAVRTRQVRGRYHDNTVSPTRAVTIADRVSDYQIAAVRSSVWLDRPNAERALITENRIATIGSSDTPRDCNNRQPSHLSLLSAPAIAFTMVGCISHYCRHNTSILNIIAQNRSWGWISSGWNIRDTINRNKWHNDRDHHQN